jgi:hypothetical protein
LTRCELGRVHPYISRLLTGLLQLDPGNETGGFCNGAVHVKWFLFAAAKRVERLKIAFQAVDPPLVAVLSWEAGRPFFVPSPAFRIPERAEGVEGPKR